MDGHLAIMPAPQADGLERAILYWKEEGVDIVVSLLEQDEVPGLIEAEIGLCDEIGLDFLWFPIQGRICSFLGKRVQCPDSETG